MCCGRREALRAQAVRAKTAQSYQGRNRATAHPSGPRNAWPSLQRGIVLWDTSFAGDIIRHHFDF